MINTVQVRAAIDAMQGDYMIVPKAQMAEILHEVDLGNNARRVVSSIKAIAGLSTAGARATA